MKKLVLTLSVIAASMAAYTQPQGDIRGPISNPTPGVLDGFYVKENIPTKKIVPYEPVREADVVWGKRVWRAIDLREKFNHPLYYPLDDFREGEDPDSPVWRKNTSRWSLWTILRYHIISGDLTLYSPFDPDWSEWDDGDLFKYPYTPEKYGSLPDGNFMTDPVFRENVKGMEYLGYEEFNPNPEAIESVAFPGEDSVDANENVVYYPNEFNWYTSDDIVQYRIKEDWFFDKKRSVMDFRIIGICPVVHARDANGNITGLKELFWVYFPESRYILQNFFVQNARNDAQRMSFDDLFWKRMFHSFIIKESNLSDREIWSYRAGVDALLESEKIKDNLFNFEHDLWSY